MIKYYKKYKDLKKYIEPKEEFNVEEPEEEEEEYENIEKPEEEDEYENIEESDEEFNEKVKKYIKNFNASEEIRKDIEKLMKKI